MKSIFGISSLGLPFALSLLTQDMVGREDVSVPKLGERQCKVMIGMSKAKHLSSGWCKTGSCGMLQSLRILSILYSWLV